MAYLVILCLSAVRFVAAVLGDSSNGCTTFSTDGSAAAYFEYYRFYDFRNINTSLTAQNTLSDGSLLPASKIVNNASWADDWSIRVQSKGAANDNALPIQYSASNVKIQTSTDASREYTTYLTLSTTRLESSQQAGELDYTCGNISHASIRVLARVRGAPGAVAGIFTYWNDTTESDIEILSRDPETAIHYSNQPTTTDSGAAVPGSSWNVSMPPGAAWTGWNVHRLDWLPGQSAWFVNGVQMARTAVNVPQHPSMLILNMWSNGGAWSGVMDVGATAELQIQWVEVAFNASSEANTASPSTSKPVVCSVDKVVGSTVVAQGAVSIWDHGTVMIWLSLSLTTVLLFV